MNQISQINLGIAKLKLEILFIYNFATKDS